MIIGLTGYARSGKDTVANILVKDYGYKRLAFADKIRDFLVEIDPILENGHRLSSTLEEYGWEIAKAKPEVRRLLQALGLGARTLFGTSFWIDQAFSSIDDDYNYVITDVRFINEAETVKNYGGQLWRVKRPGIVAYNRHVSETEMDGYPVDQIFSNHGSIEDLSALVKNRMEMQ